MLTWILRVSIRETCTMVYFRFQHGEINTCILVDFSMLEPDFEDLEDMLDVQYRPKGENLVYC